MPSRWHLRLIGSLDAEIPLEAPHAVVSRWLDTDASHKAPAKPYAISPPVPDGRHLVIEVRLLDDLLASRMSTTVHAGTIIRFGRHHFRAVGAPCLVEATPWRELSARHTSSDAPRENAWRVAFQSPTTFRSGDRSSPFPAPESVLRGLLARWRTVGPRSAPGVETGLARSVWVSDIEGRTVAVRRAGRIVAGFVGQVRYVCDGSAGERDTVRSLLRFAEYAGIGSHTAFGFGTVRLDRVWPSAGDGADAHAAEAAEMTTRAENSRSTQQAPVDYPHVLHQNR